MAVVGDILEGVEAESGVSEAGGNVAGILEVMEPASAALVLVLSCTDSGTEAKGISRRVVLFEAGAGFDFGATSEVGLTSVKKLIKEYIKTKQNKTKQNKI